jgi:DNA-binding transcriptional LysR family regulator
VRAFVVTAELLHFGRAAERLGISQQALSKRIARLETELGALLFERGGQGVSPTEAGRRFAAPAARLLQAADEAVAQARGDLRGPVRLDVWGHLYAPMRTVAHLVDALPDVAFETGSGRDLPAVAAALLRGDTDLGFGRVHPVDGRFPAGLAHRLVRLEPVDVLVGADHPFASAESLRPADLAASVMWCPAALERLDFLRRFAEQFGITRRETGPNLGLEHTVEHIRTHPHCFTILPADAPLPDPAGGPGVRSIPLVDPTPLYAWSLLWRDGPDRHPRIADVLRVLGEQAARRRWLEYDPDRDWLPDVDRGEPPAPDTPRPALR